MKFQNISIHGSQNWEGGGGGDTLHMKATNGQILKRSQDHNKIPLNWFKI